MTIGLHQLTKGVCARIAQVCFPPATQQRLAQLGLAKGQEVYVIRPSHGKGPMMVRMHGTYVMVRHQDAEKIAVTPH